MITARKTPRHVPFRRLRWIVAVAGVLLAVLGGLGGSESGFRFLCAALAQLSAGRFQIESPRGYLLGDWQAQSVRWHDSTQDVEVKQLTVAWSPRELLQGQLAFERVEASSLRIFSAPSSEPVKLPDALRIPLAIRISHLLLGRVMFGESTENDKNLLIVAEGIDAALASDGQLHRLEHLRARMGRLALSADATLVGVLPFTLKAQAALTGSSYGQSFSLDLLGSGSLGRLQIDGTATASTGKTDTSGASGELHALLTPFSAQPLSSLNLKLNGLDPSTYVTGAPQALFDIEALLDSKPTVAGQPGELPDGRLHITNRRSGALDQLRLPLESLQSQLKWQGERLSFEGLVVALSGGGRLKGQGSFANGQLDLDLAASGVNARSLHGRLVPTRLAGPLRAQIGGDSQTLELNLRDAIYALSARASLTPEAVELSSLQLATGKARLAAQGRLALTGEERFAAQGSVQNFDPARFFKTKTAVRSVINASFEAKGALSPALELALHFNLRDSRLGPQKLTGKGDVDLRGTQWRKIEIDLEAAGNRLFARGAFGRAGDTLRLNILAPKLEALGWPGIAGDAKANLVLGGSIARPEFAGDAQVTHLRLSSLLDLKGLSLNARLGEGERGVLAGQLRCSSCALPIYGIPGLVLEANAEGLRNLHHLDARVGLPGKRELRLALDGGLLTEVSRKPASTGPTSGTPAMLWGGTLNELRLSKVDSAGAPPLLELTAPAPLRVSRATVSFGPASIDGLIGRLRVDRLSLEQGRWQSTGRLQQFRPQAVLAEFPALGVWPDALGKANPQPLVLGGEWDFAALGLNPTGKASVWREQGDLLFGSVLLGLSEARLQATLGDGRLVASGQFSGSRLGNITAEFNASSGTSEAALIDPLAPWQGRLQARVPDLAWMGPLLGEGWQIAGQLDGEMRLSGSAAHPQWNGEWRGDKLALRELDRGVRMERGQALVEINPERLLLRRLSFESDFQPMPRTLALDMASLTSTPGRFEASGELALAGATASNAARLSVRMDRVGVMQRPDQWLAVSGEGEVRVGERALDIGGKLRVDAGFWSMGKSGRPSLSDDVVIRPAPSAQGAGGRSNPAETGTASPVSRALRLSLEVELGKSFHFRGVGVESKLAGQVRIRSDDAGLPRASGSIQTVEGRFDAYGQKLGIERGIINFQGSIDNPGLNILAVRNNLPVEAGVEVTGTAQRPLIRLVSTPVVPDSEKLSWLVLGRSPEQNTGGDSSLLLAAAQTIFGGQDGGILSKIQQGLGIDEFGVSSSQGIGSSRLPTSRVVNASGFGSSPALNQQIMSVGKRLSSNALIGYEQSLNTTDSVVKLTVNLSRQFSIVGRAGSDSSLDFFWNHSFGR